MTNEQGGNVERRLPPSFLQHVETVETIAPLRVNVGEVYLGDEAHAGGLKGVLWRNCELQFENTTLVWSVDGAADLGVQQGET